MVYVQAADLQDQVNALKEEKDRLRAEVEALKAKITRMAKWMKNNEDGRLPDHACQRCVPHSDILIPGFDCAYHEAMDILNNERQGD
jgi:hypothetical protein